MLVIMVYNGVLITCISGGESGDTPAGIAGRFGLDVCADGALSRNEYYITY
jgi:hypothetical protein